MSNNRKKILFDPNKPFEVVSSENGKAQVTFDPGKPFEVIDEPRKPGKDIIGQFKESIPEVGKQLAGVAIGATEAVNPLNIPRGIEILGRAALTESGGPIERLKKAGESAVLPELRIQETIAPGIRAGARGIKSIVTGESPEFSKKFQEEKEVQKPFQEEVSTAQGATELGFGLYSLASLGRQALKSLKLSNKLKNVADQFSFDSLKPLGKAADKIVDQNRATAVGGELLARKIVTPGASYKTILSRVNKSVDDVGEQVGFYAKTADKAAEANSAVKQLNAADIVQDIKSTIVTPLSNKASTLDVAKEVDRWADNFLIVHGKKALSFVEAQKEKRLLELAKAKFSKSGDSLSRDAFQNVYRLLNNKIEEGIDVALKAAHPEMTNGFVAAKESFRNLKDAQSLISKTVSRQSKNRWFSLTDYGSAGTAAIAGTFATGGPSGLLAAIPVGLANKLVRTRGNQVAASALDAAAKFIEGASPRGLDDALKVTGLLNLITPKKQIPTPDQLTERPSQDLRPQGRGF